MVCIYCKNPTSVTNSRYKKRYFKVWRRRVCSHCEAIFTTYEVYDYSNALMVQKRSGGLEAFSRDKILISIINASNHKKTIARDAIQLVDNIMIMLLNKNSVEKIITTKNISQTTSLVLKRYDTISALKYVSYQNPDQPPSSIKNMLA